MLSYQHHYHAGNHGDVLKHWLLIECVRYLQQKDKVFDYIDTHAGAGLYSLDSAEARKTAESDQGVRKLNWSNLPGLEDYRTLIQQDLAENRYPGSPCLVNRMLRPGEHAWLFEMHPKTIEELRRHCARKRVSYVKHEDGFKGLPALLPNKSRRALALIDPSYEVKSDYQTVVKVMVQAYKKMQQIQLLLWYPVVNRQLVNDLEKTIKKSPLRNVQLFEMNIADDNAKGMSGSGMIVVNPPWTLADRFNEIIPAVSASLAVDGVSRYRFEQLTP